MGRDKGIVVEQVFVASPGVCESVQNPVRPSAIS